MGIEPKRDFEARLQTLEAGAGAADARLERIEHLASRILDAVTLLGERMDRLESRIDALESRIGNLENRMDRSESRQEIFDGRLANIEKILGEHSVIHHKHDLNFQTAAITAEFTLREAKGISERQFALERDLRRYHWIAFGVAASAAGALALARGN